MNPKMNLRPALQYAGILALLFLSVFIFIYPIIEGKRLKTNDLDQFRGAAKAISDFRAETGKEALWTNNMFGGMPAYMISTYHPGNLVSKTHYLFTENFYPGSILLLTLVCFFILLITLKINKWLSLIGAMAFGFSNYMLIIMAAGHASKAYAIAYLALAAAGILLIFRHQYLKGGLLFALGLSFQLAAFHPQITYYGVILLGILVVFEFVGAIKFKNVIPFFKALGILTIGVVLALVVNASLLLTTWEYSKETIRSKTELTDANNVNLGMDKESALAWSQEPMENLTLLIPDFMGRSHKPIYNENSVTFRLMKQKGVANPKESNNGILPYHGNKPSTDGGAYAGAVMFFLFVLGIFIVKSTLKYWLLSATVISVVLAMGKYLGFVNGLLLSFLPLYSKFRAPDMILIIAVFSITLLGIIALNQILENKPGKTDFQKGLKWATIMVGGICLVFALLPGIATDFKAPFDSTYSQWLLDGISADRRHMLRADAFRSLIFIVLAAATLLLWNSGKIRKNIFLLVLGGLILMDIVPVSKRFLNSANFTSKREIENYYLPGLADREILRDKDLSYRVLDLQNPFQNTRTSYHHKNMLGYSAAKLRRPAEVTEKYLVAEMKALTDSLRSQPVPSRIPTGFKLLNMLNNRYVMISKDMPPLKNSAAMGNAWFVDNLQTVKNTDEEFNALGTFDPAKTAIVEQLAAQSISTTFVRDSVATIVLTECKPNYLKYDYKTNTPQFAVFSEIYYDKGWKAFVDGLETPYFRANYILRAMALPAGNHTVEFEFEPKSFFTGNKISLAGSLLLVIVLAGYVVLQFRSGKQIGE